MEAVSGDSGERDPELSSCSLCGTPGSLLHSDMSDRHFDAPGVFSLLECPACQLVWLHPKPQATEVPALYESYYTHETPRSKPRLRRLVEVGIPAAAFGYERESLPATDLLAARALAWVGPLRQLAQHSVMWLPAALRGRLLDVGCGSGDFLADMKARGWSVAGVEPDPRAAQLARERLDTKAVYANTSAVPDEEAGFDAVTLAHVIEHLLDPSSTLRDCLRLLRPGGRLVITTPNAASLGRLCFGRAWVHWDPPRHIHVFTAETLEKLVRQAGFAVSSVSTPSSTAHFAWQSSSLIRSRGRLPGIIVEGASLGSKLASVLFVGIEYLLTLLGRRCGEELLVIAEKPRSSPAASS